MSATLAVFQLAKCWLKAVAAWNVEAIVETDATFHLPRSALNVAAAENKLAMSATLAVFQLEMSWLKTDAPENIEAIVETAATFHRPMSALNVGFLAKSSYMLETELTSHSSIGPYVVVAAVTFVSHAVTAMRMFVSTRQNSG
jgi:hypothetical protein